MVTVHVVYFTVSVLVISSVPWKYSETDKEYLLTKRFFQKILNFPGTLRGFDPCLVAWLFALYIITNFVTNCNNICDIRKKCCYDMYKCVTKIVMI